MDIAVLFARAPDQGNAAETIAEDADQDTTADFPATFAGTGQRSEGAGTPPSPVFQLPITPARDTLPMPVWDDAHPPNDQAKVSETPVGQVLSLPEPTLPLALGPTESGILAVVPSVETKMPPSTVIGDVEAPRSDPRPAGSSPDRQSTTEPGPTSRSGLQEPVPMRADRPTPDTTNANPVVTSAPKGDPIDPPSNLRQPVVDGGERAAALTPAKDPTKPGSNHLGDTLPQTGKPSHFGDGTPVSRVASVLETSQTPAAVQDEQIKPRPVATETEQPVPAAQNRAVGGDQPTVPPVESPDVRSPGHSQGRTEGFIPADLPERHAPTPELPISGTRNAATMVRDTSEVPLRQAGPAASPNLPERSARSLASYQTQNQLGAELPAAKHPASSANLESAAIRLGGSVVSVASADPFQRSAPAQYPRAVVAEGGNLVPRRQTVPVADPSTPAIDPRAPGTAPLPVADAAPLESLGPETAARDRRVPSDATSPTVRQPDADVPSAEVPKEGPPRASQAPHTGTPPVAPDPGQRAVDLTGVPDAPAPGGPDIGASDARGSDPSSRADPASARATEAARPVIAQLIETFQKGNGTIDVTLSPEELGRLTLSMSSEDGVLTVAVQAERPETLELIRRNLDLLHQEAKNAGYSDVNFDFGSGQGQGGGPQAEVPGPVPTDDAQVSPGPRAPQSLPQSASRTALDIRI